MTHHTPQLLAWSFPSSTALDEALQGLRQTESCTELLPIGTCQRFELFALAKDSRSISIEGAMQSFDGSDAATRLFAIAAGTLSDIPGEVAIAEQVRSRLRTALKRKIAGTVLARLTRRAIASGEQLRRRVRESAPILELADLVTMRLQDLRRPEQQAGRITVLGAGRVGRSIVASLQRAGTAVDTWATCHPRSDNSGPNTSIERALADLKPHGRLIVALGGHPRRISTEDFPDGIVSIDLSMPPVLDNSTLNLRAVLDRSQAVLQPQRDAVERAAHRLRARAEAALAESLCPSMTAINESIARFRKAIIDAEYTRLRPMLGELPVSDADRLRRSIRHTAARCVHPIHEYVNTLGRQGRVEEARAVVDHLLGTRVGLTIDSDAQPSDAPLSAQNQK